MSALEKGEHALKTRFFFRIYDRDQDGYITRADLTYFALASALLEDDRTGVVDMMV
jgi:Ca2+-binding EF-hand superfamily protein